jgi:hypothetical protein
MRFSAPWSSFIHGLIAFSTAKCAGEAISTRLHGPRFGAASMAAGIFAGSVITLAMRMEYKVQSTQYRGGRRGLYSALWTLY